MTTTPHPYVNQCMQLAPRVSANTVFDEPCAKVANSHKFKWPSSREQTCLHGAALAAAHASRWLAKQPSAFVEELLSEACVREFKRGCTIVAAQEHAASMHFLVQGRVEVWIPSIRHELVVVHLLSPHDWFGDLSALAGIPSPTEYRARTSCVTLSVPRAHIVRMQLSGYEHIRPMFELITSTAAQMAEIAAEAAVKDPMVRIVTKLLILSSGSPLAGGNSCVPISQAELADLCGLSRTTVSLVLGGLEQQGIVTLGYARILIKNREDLVAILAGMTP